MNKDLFRGLASKQKYMVPIQLAGTCGIMNVIEFWRKPSQVSHGFMLIHLKVKYWWETGY